MKGRLALIFLFSLTIVIALVGVLNGTTGVDNAGSTTSHDVVTDLGELHNLEADHHMLEQMRATAVPNTGVMADQNPMWDDPDTVRLQEQYEAQIDRMIGRRPGQS